MASTTALAYKERDSVIHKLTGTTKLVFFLLWSFGAMFTYDTRVLLAMFLISLLLFRLSKIKWNEVRFALIFMFTLILINMAAIYFFAPEQGVKIYGTRHEIIRLFLNYSVTWEQLFYMFSFTMKYFAVIPVSLLFIMTTNPSEFASSLNHIGVSYRVGYSVSIALRYIPDIKRDYHNIMQAQQARGLELSSKDKLIKRLKNSALILLPLILSSINRIEVISNAMELRGFGKNKKRTWYVERPFAWQDVLAICIGIATAAISLLVVAKSGSRFYNPFI